MSGQLNAIKSRIKSVESTKKITYAMQMVAAAKLARFQDMMQKAQPYMEGLQDLMNRLTHDQLAKQAEAKKRNKNFPPLHPFFEKREENKIAFVLLTSDTGLCGSYNHDLAHMAEEFLENYENRVSIIGIGKWGINALTKLGFPIYKSFTEIRVSRVEEILKGLNETLQKIYLEQKVDAVYVGYSHFVSRAIYKNTVQKLLPFEQPEAAEEKKSQADILEYIYEPSQEIVFGKLIPQFFEAKIRMIFLESFVSEQIARMSAMRQATDNAKDMIDSLVLLRNKARQAAITKEIIEIVSGSKALK